MKVLFVNTSERIGGAAIAANRIMAALRRQHIQTRMLVLHRNTPCAYVVEHTPLIGFLKPISDWCRFVYDRLVVFLTNHFHRAHLFEVDAAVSGYDITTMPAFKEADIVHLHWVNQGFMSMKSLEKLAASGKPVVWTFHDMWAFTGICHHARACVHYHTYCHHCPYLYHEGSADDLSTRTFKRKQQLFAHAPHWKFVAVSDWLRMEAEKSALLQGRTITTIPNALDTKKYHCDDAWAAREALQLSLDKTILLFVAYRVNDPNKGYDYLCASINRLIEEHPELRETLVLAAAGREAEQLKEVLPISVYDMGYVTDPTVMIQLYGAADLLLMPTLQDTLPNTIAESMACDTPCVAFRVGGVPEMIDHQQNGYLANYLDVEDFANGILWCLQNNKDGSLSTAARAKAVEAYSEAVVATKYKEIYDTF